MAVLVQQVHQVLWMVPIDNCSMVCQSIQNCTPGQLDLILIIWNMEASCAHWHKARESTSSSYSGLHFGHYKAVASSSHITYLHTRFTQLVINDQFILVMVQVILEKMVGVIHVILLCAILLMAANFNGTMKILIGHWMICNAIKIRLFPRNFLVAFQNIEWFRSPWTIVWLQMYLGNASQCLLLPLSIALLVTIAWHTPLPP